MKSRSHSSQPGRFSPRHWAAVAALAIAAAALWAVGVQAQTIGRVPGQRSVQAVPNPAANNNASGTFGLPNPAGLSSPSPFPAGLPPVVTPSAASPTGAPGFGAPTGGPGTIGNGGTVGGVGVGNGVGVAPVTDPTFIDGGSVGNPTAVLGAGPGVPPIPQYVPSGSGPFNPVEVARSFIGADANRDGELTQGEWRRLAIRPGSFETMDRNFDGRISRSEYDDGLR